MKHTIVVLVLIMAVFSAQAQEKLFTFGEVVPWGKVVDGQKAKGEAIEWIQVNTLTETWKKNGEELICKGQPIGVIRSAKKYRNFMMHIEWRHMEAGGNSGTFVWSDANADETNRLPNGVEVQMLELDWVKLNTRDGKEPPIAYVHGELFGVGGVKTVPDNPRGERSKSIENRCKGKGEWNVYDVVCVDGTIKLSVNGKFVNGISKSSKTEGYICLESEGAEIHFRNLKILELP
ncbi:DUF1080 domain-containing protein [Maribellus sp. CM-23]|uniref:3-keto-disaccharide hydrolase n=1 Tax=Maribellus sp. CM-23 TaxID=2781026 RepID=UPI001F1EE895|nr:DUF1080 domain-containing protein [Maribellus sp. CM-23]MCE4563350.1 DUF1080 domain-containing protein [Maribellus sp. CM-23]